MGPKCVSNKFSRCYYKIKALKDSLLPQFFTEQVESHALNNLRRLVLTTDFCKQTTLLTSFFEVKFKF